ncbi:hypothetical protein SDRG_16968 [Saprolegnia diclina VS20]|uniref:WRKY19-like zinc finger domain-containing protein n=1 Tax=Saprolegnia diclina (strain VS20) TaxID=1156394 RepID=T0PSE1_SAPDV|nr:hypothetical protein SDRG_16968 [Saprolegnia diclina VS20]EQC25161.1 hypothetical protein SDRG_16968 [Saprolegnia diclina VS20]|eukprot:XP_008621418.1 hypothetical protein SDRG_16968 [Saprolegnia diclina VS20]
MDTPARSSTVRRCSRDGCLNQVYARALCVRHGGKKQCRVEGCSTYARGGAFCFKHGGRITRRYCIEPGCAKQAHARQRCVRHGGGRKCKVNECEYLAKYSGYCRRHTTATVASFVNEETPSSTSAVDAMDIEFDMLTLLAQPTSDAEDTDDEAARHGIDWIHTLNESPP